MELTRLGQNLGLFTDLYELTMAQVYWENGMAEWESAFHYFYRTVPSGGGYSIACGLQSLIDYLMELSFVGEDIDYLGIIPGADGKRLFPNMVATAVIESEPAVKPNDVAREVN